MISSPHRLALLALLVVAGCGFGDDRAQIVGSWRVVPTAGSQFRIPGSYEVTAYRFDADGTFVATQTHLIRAGKGFALATSESRGSYGYHRLSEHLAELNVITSAGRGRIAIYVTKDAFDISDDRYERVRGTAQGHDASAS